MRNYLRCVIANKATLWTYAIMACVAVIALFIIIVLGPTSLLYSPESFAALWCFGMCSLLINLCTGFGYCTYSAYRRTKAHIQEHERVDERFSSYMRYSYCNMRGFELAVSEAGLTI